MRQGVGKVKESEIVVRNVRIIMLMKYCAKKLFCYCNVNDIVTLFMVTDVIS